MVDGQQSEETGIDGVSVRRKSGEAGRKDDKTDKADGGKVGVITWQARQVEESVMVDWGLLQDEDGKHRLGIEQ